MRLRFAATLGPKMRGFELANSGEEISFLPLERIWADDRFDSSEVIEFSGDVASYNAVNEGDLLVPKVSPTFAHGRAAIARGLVGGRALATSEVFVIRAHDPGDTRFLQYRLIAPDFLSAGQSAWTGVAGLRRVSGDFVKNTWIEESAWEQRRSITAFLDRECERIDRARRTAREMHAAALVAFRDWSADAFLASDGGRTDRLKFLFRLPVGGAWGSPADVDEVNVRCARVADFDREALVVAQPETLRSVPLRDAHRLRLSPGDLLLEKSGGGAKSPVGFVARFDGHHGDEAVVCSNFIARLRPQSGNDPLYLTHLFGALYRTRRNVGYIKQNTGIQNLDVAAYLAQHVPHRQLEDQQVLAREAESRLAAALHLRRQGDFLQAALGNYRATLIHEAVNGLLDPSRLDSSEMAERLSAVAQGAGR